MIVALDINKLPNAACNWTYNNSAVDSKLRQAIVDQYAYAMDKETLEKKWEFGNISQQLLFDMTMVYRIDSLLYHDGIRGGSCNGRTLRWEIYGRVEDFVVKRYISLAYYQCVCSMVIWRSTSLVLDLCNCGHSLSTLLPGCCQRLVLYEDIGVV